MRKFQSTPLMQPYLKTTELYLPSGRRLLRGNGLVFINTIRDAIHCDGLWLVMQDSDGQTAISLGDIVTHAKILSVDWLSSPQVCVELDIDALAIISTPANKYHHLGAKLAPLWTPNQYLTADKLLVSKLKELLQEYDPQQPHIQPDSPSFNNPCWLCWRWLELLPLPLTTKQRLLNYPTPDICLRYLTKIIRQSDLYAEIFR